MRVYSGERWAVVVGHVLDVLRQMPEKSVHCVVTSPPYYGLRAYGTNPQTWGGDSGCAHEWASAEVVVSDSAPSASSTLVGNGHVGGGPKMHVERPVMLSGFCQRCKAWRGEFGAEPAPDLYVEHLVTICREIRRVLRDDGTFWLNLGSSYAATHQGRYGRQRAETFHAPGANYRSCDFNALLQLSNNVIAFLFWAAVPVSLLLFAYPGWLLLVVGYSEGNIKTAKDIFWNVIWGLIFMAGAWLLVYVITTTLLRDDIPSSSGFLLERVR